MYLNGRKKALEMKFILAEEQEFKLKIMASKLFGLWGAEQMKLDHSIANSYIKSLIELSINTTEFAPIINKLEQDLHKAGINLKRDHIESVFLEKLNICIEKLTKY